MDILLIGRGAMAVEVLRRLAPDEPARIAAVLVRPASAAAARAALSPAIAVVTSVDELAAEPELAVECAGHESSVRGCLEALRPMGRYTQVGICGREIKFPIDQIFYKQLTLSGSICYTAGTWARMMKIYAQGRVRIDDIVSNKLPISDWRTAFDLCMQKRGLKILMYPE